MNSRNNASISNEKFLEKHQDVFSTASLLEQSNGSVHLADLAVQTKKTLQSIQDFVRSAKRRNLWNYKSASKRYNIDPNSLWQRVFNCYKENKKIKPSEVVTLLGLEKCKNFSVCCYLYQMRRADKVNDQIQNHP